MARRGPAAAGTNMRLYDVVADLLLGLIMESIKPEG